MINLKMSSVLKNLRKKHGGNKEAILAGLRVAFKRAMRAEGCPNRVLNNWTLSMLPIIDINKTVLLIEERIQAWNRS